jgi:hypothetical protein
MVVAVVAMAAGAEMVLMVGETLVAAVAVADLPQLNGMGNCCSDHCCQVFTTATNYLVVDW